MLRPNGMRVAIEPNEAADQTASGIFLPEQAKERPVVGTIVAIGDGEYRDGRHHTIDVEVGTKVLYSKYAGTDVDYEGRELLVIRFDDILAFLP